VLVAGGAATVFVTGPISAVLLAIAAVLLSLAVLPSIRGKRDEVFVGDD
jgi:putative tricarboxylic transport membrane protein